VLTGGGRDVPDRQRTLRHTIAWSHELLDETEQRLFARLAIFVGTFTLDAAEQVCAADLDTVASLVEKSLLRQGADQFRMLATIREFALERLEESAEREEIARRHIDFFLTLAEREGSDVEREASLRLERMDSQHDNFRAALQFARELDEPSLELRLVSALGGFWQYRSHLSEGLERIRGALSRDPGVPAVIRGHALRMGTMIAYKQGDVQTARQMAEELRQLHDGTGDEEGVAQSMTLLGIIALEERRFGRARTLLEQAKSIHERLGNDLGLQAAFHNLGLLAMGQGDYGRARAELGSALAISEKHGLEGPAANNLCDLGFAELGDRRLDQARVRFRDALSAAVRLGWKENVAYCLVGFAALAVAAGELDRAGLVLGQAELLVEDHHLKLAGYAEAERAQAEGELVTRLGEDRLGALREEGRALSMEAVLSEAQPT
jgi:tetratricopeptide (TPR) repeat protein